MGRPAKLDITQQRKIINMYVNEKLSTNKISKLFLISSETVRNILIKNNIVLRDRHESNKLSTKFSFKEMTSEKAFLLGLIYGDGSISIRQDYINITSGDYDLLEKSQKILGAKFKINKVKNSNCWCGVIYSHKLCEELLELFSLTNNKSDKIVWPNLKKEFLPIFVSGYLATDGCISVSKKDNLLILSFYSCSKIFLEQLNNYLCYATNQKLRTIYKRENLKGHLGKKPLYTLVFNGLKAKMICNFLFKHTTQDTRSNRKYNIYNNYITPGK